MMLYANSNGRDRHPAKNVGLSAPKRIDFGWDKEWELAANRQRQASGERLARQAASVAPQLSPVAVRIWLDTFPSARTSFNVLLDRLLQPLLIAGERERVRTEANWFRVRGTSIAVMNTNIAHQAALSEVLAANASTAKSEGEAASFIGTTIPIVLRVMSAYRSLRPFLPALLAAAARLVRLFYRHSPSTRNLLRLIPSLLRRAISTLQIARRCGYSLTSALLGCVLASHTRRLLGNWRSVGESIDRNALIQSATVV